MIRLALAWGAHPGLANGSLPSLARLDPARWLMDIPASERTSQPSHWPVSAVMSQGLVSPGTWIFRK